MPKTKPTPLHEAIPDLEALLTAADAEDEQRRQAVARVGVELLEAEAAPGANPAVVFLFALAHDECYAEAGAICQVVTNMRALDLVDSVIAEDLVRLSRDEARLLRRACRNRPDTSPVSNPTLAVCYDAVRLNFGEGPASLGPCTTPYGNRSSVVAGCVRRRGKWTPWPTLFARYARLSAATSS